MRKIVDITKKLFVAAGLVYVGMMVTGCGGTGQPNLFRDTVSTLGKTSENAFKNSSLTVPVGKGTPDSSLKGFAIHGDKKGGIDLPRSYQLCPDCRVVANLGAQNLINVPDKLTVGKPPIVFGVPIPPDKKDGIKNSFDSPFELSLSKNPSVKTTLIGLNPNAEKTGPSAQIDVGMSMKGPFADIVAGGNLPGKAPSITTGFHVGGANPNGSGLFVDVGGKVGPASISVPVFNNGEFINKDNLGAQVGLSF